MEYQSILPPRKSNSNKKSKTKQSKDLNFLLNRDYRTSENDSFVNAGDDLRYRVSATTPPPKKNLLQKTGGVAKGLGEGIASSYNRTSQGIAESLAYNTKDQKNARKAVEQAQNSDAQIASTLAKASKNADQATKDRINKVLESNKGNSLDTFQKANERNKQIQDRTDPLKAAAAIASIGLDITTLGTGTAAIQAAKLAAKQGGKVAAKQTAKRIASGASQGSAAGGLNAVQENGKDVTFKDIAKGASIGAALGGALPSVAPILKGADKAVSNVAGKAGLKQLSQDGVFGTLDKAVSKAGSKITYAGSDLISKTKVGQKVIGLKDDFLSKWVSDLHPVYKALKRSDFNGKTTGAYAAARESVGNANRALSYSQDFIENNQNAKTVTQGLQERGPDLIKTRKEFDEYAKARSELELATSGKKEFSPEKIAEYKKRLDAVGGDKFDKEYQGLVGIYKDVNDLRLQNGTMSKADHQRFLDEPYDYIRQQRELPDWLIKKPGGDGTGSKVSIAKSQAIQKRNKYADSELLSPLETLTKTVQLAHVEIYRNKAAKSVYSLLEQAGEAKLMRSTDLVRERQALLADLKNSKPIVTKLNRLIRTQGKQVRQLQTILNDLNKKGMNIRLKEGGNNLPQDFLPSGLGKKLGPKDTRAFLKALVAEDPAKLKQIRKMIESRDAKLAPLLDQVEIASRDLQELYAQRTGIYNQAMATKVTVDKARNTTMSFLDDGVENVAKIDPSIASAVHNWDKQSQNVLNETLRFANQVFKYGTTGANAGFAIPNFIADQVGSAINSKSIFVTHNPVNFVHSLFISLGVPLTAKDRQLLLSYNKANKGQLSINQYTKPKSAERAANELVKNGAGVGQKFYTNIRHGKEGLRQLFDSTESLVGFTEKLTRVQNYRGTYKKASKQGLDKEALANQAARENSIDFLEFGSYGRVVNNFIPYFNASIQGNRTLLRNLSERPVSTTAKITTLISVPVASTTIWNTSDKDRKAIYNTIPEYVKEGNFVIISPGAKWNADKKRWDGVYTIKKPPGSKELSEPIRKYIEYTSDNDSDKAKTLKGFLGENAGSLAGDFGSIASPIDFSSPDKFLSSVTPQILKPTAEAISNHNFFTGEQIVSDSKLKLPVEEQKNTQYSQLTSHIAGIFNTSPLKVDQWIKQTFGEVGTNTVNSVDRLSGAPKEAVGGRSLPESIKRRFTDIPGGEDADAFYKTYNPARQDYNSVNNKINDLISPTSYKPKEAQRIADEYNATVDKRFENFYKQYGNSPTLDPEWAERIGELKFKKINAKARAKD